MSEASEKASIQFTESPEIYLQIVDFTDTSKDDGSFLGWDLYVDTGGVYRQVSVTRFDPEGDVLPVRIDIKGQLPILAEVLEVVDRIYLKINTADKHKLEKCPQVNPDKFLSGPLILPL